MIVFSCGGFFSGFWVFGVIGWVGFMSVNECMLFFFMVILQILGILRIHILCYEVGAFHVTD